MLCLSQEYAKASTADTQLFQALGAVVRSAWKVGALHTPARCRQALLPAFSLSIGSRGTGCHRNGSCPASDL